MEERRTFAVPVIVALLLLLTASYFGVYYAMLSPNVTVRVAASEQTAMSEDEAWLVAPPVAKLVLVADREARDELVKVIAAKQDKLPRDDWNLEIPSRASGVPAEFDLTLYRSNGCFSESRARLEIRIRNDRSRWELCELSGLYRGERAAQDVDRLVRQLVYAFYAVETPKIERAWTSGGSVGPAPVYIEVVSKDDKSAFHLQSMQLEVDHNSDGTPTDRIRNYAFAILVERLFEIVERECKRISPEDESREILQELKGIPATLETKEFTAWRRAQVDLEESLFGDLAVKHSLKEALPELERLSLADQLRQLQIAIAADSKPLVVQAITEYAKNQRLATWAVRFALDDQHPERLNWLIAVLPRLDRDPGSHTADTILSDLSRKKLTKQQLIELAGYFSEAKSPRLKISLAHTLLEHTHEKAYFDYLETVVRTAPADLDAEVLQVAARHTLRYAVRSGKQRVEARLLLHHLLKRTRQQQTPDSFEMFELVGILGDLGTSDDVPYLAGLAQTPSAYLASFAIPALAKLDARRALAILHTRIERWNKRPPDSLTYSHEIFPHFALMMFERDVAAVPLLKTAWARLNKRKPSKSRDEPDSERISESYDPVHVISFLQATTGPARAEAAIAQFRDRAHLEDREQMQRFVDQLIAEGAEPEECQLLLTTPNELRRDR